VKRLLPLIICTAIGLVILCGLGTWQVFRLAEKNKLIAQLEARMNAAPIPLAQALQHLTLGENVEYLKVWAEGSFDVAHIFKKQTSAHGQPAWEAIAPFAAVDGQKILVDLGIAAKPDHVAEKIIGILRLHNKGRGYFDVENNPARNEWFWWDVPTMQSIVGIQGPPVIIQSLQSGGGFEALPPKVELSNNHMGYAITWFGLAAALAAVAGFLGRSMLLDRKD
jgi:surfeit locus 1 family protein